MTPSLYLLPLILILPLAHTWRITATLTNGKVEFLNSSTGATRACDGLPWGNGTMTYFDWIPNVGATTIELYPFDNCLGTKRVGGAGRNNVSPPTAYYTYKVLA